MYYFIVNYTGGGGKARKTWNRVHDLLKDKKIEYKAYVTKYPGHAGELAAKISEMDDEDIRLVVVGGDGSINEVLNGITDFERIRFGVIPTGSGNDFARGMGIPKDPDKALDIILASVVGRNIDIGEVTTGNGARSYFGISSGIPRPVPSQTRPITGSETWLSAMQAAMWAWWCWTRTSRRSSRAARSAAYSVER